MLKPIRINLNKKDIYACGRVAVWSAMLDTMMEVVIWTLLDLPKPQARQMTHGLSAGRKRELLSFLSETDVLNEDDRSELHKILESIESAFVERNRVVHGLWHIGPDNTPWVAKYNENGKLTFHDRLDEPLVHPIAETAKTLAIALANWIQDRDPSALEAAFPAITPETKPVRPTIRRRSGKK